MREAFRANVRAHLLFVRRSRLLLSLAIVLAVLFALSMIPVFVFGGSTASGQFERLRGVHATASGFLFVFAAVLGLLLVVAPIRDRSLKMVMTRPCPPIVWLAAAYAAAGLVVAGVYLVFFLAASVTCFSLGLPVQGGLIFQTMSEALAALTAMSFVLPLGLAVHPLLALGLAVILTHDLWGSLAELALRSDSGAAAAAGWIARSVDLILPRYAVGDVATLARIDGSWRVDGTDWWLLAAHSAYALAWVAVSFAWALFLLRRRSLA